MERLTAIGIITLLLAACGGGGGESDVAAPAPIPPPGPTDFNTMEPALLVTGGTATFNMTGTINTTAATASFSFQNLGPTVISGQTVDQFSIVIVVRESSGATTSSGNTSYFETDGSLIYQERSDGVQCFPGSNYMKLPDTMRAGDSGVLGIVTCTDGLTLSATWLAETSNLNSAWLAVRLFSTSDDGIIVLTQELVRHIEETGKTNAMEWHADAASGGSIDFTT
jgi:hypothetical protein